MNVKVIFGPNGDMGVLKTIYDFQKMYKFSVDMEFDILYGSYYPLIQIEDKYIQLEGYSDEQIQDILKNIFNNKNVIEGKDNQVELFQFYHRDTPPNAGLSEVLI